MLLSLLTLYDQGCNVAEMTDCYLELQSFDLQNTASNDTDWADLIMKATGRTNVSPSTPVSMYWRVNPAEF